MEKEPSMKSPQDKDKTRFYYFAVLIAAATLLVITGHENAAGFIVVFGFLTLSD
jgi:hypothetical protein